jgi:N-acyl-D-aspartate/D-glutamate deacylase
MLTMTRNEAVPLESMREGMPWDWETFPQFLDSLDRTPKGVNMLTYVPLNPLMMYVMGLDAAKSRPASKAERDRMCELLDEAMAHGACGFSAQMSGNTGLQRDYDGTPMITDTMAYDDLFAFAEVLAKRRDGFVQLVYSASGGLGVYGNFDLYEKVAEISGRPVIYNALTATTDQHGASQLPFVEIINWLKAANGRGNRIIAQSVTTEVNHEFTLEDWNLFDSSPLWMELTMGDIEGKKAKMADLSRRSALRDEYDSGKGPTAAGARQDVNEKLAVRVATFGEIIIETIVREDHPFKHVEGMTIAEAAEALDKHPVDAMLDIAVADDLKTTFGTPRQILDMESMKAVATAPFAVPGISDGGAHTKFLTLGAYPTEFLTKLVREHEMMDLEEAHWRLSAYPAFAAGFRDRGWIKEGSPADVIVYDFDELEMLPREVAYDFPAGAWRRTQKAKGYRYILVNGEVTFMDGQCTNATPGKLLRHGRG